MTSTFKATFKVDDCGLLIGMVSVPSGISEDDFFQNIIVPESNAYKEGFQRNLRSISEPRNSHLYSPIGYKTFGDNNLMFFSLFNDFSYPNRVFHPFNGNRGENAEYRTYDFQLVVGLNIMNSDYEYSLKSIFSESDIQAFPFTCVTRLKVNPIFLCGNGLNYTELIKTRIRSLFTSQDSVRTYIFNGVGSDELIVIVFASSMNDISKSVFRIRNLQFKELKMCDSEWFDFVCNNSLAKVHEDNNIKMEDAHIFSSSYSVSGYAINRDKTPAILPDDKCHIDFTWSIKPGHIANFTHALSQCLSDIGLNQKEILRDRLYVSDTKVQLPLNHERLGETSADFFRILDTLRDLDIYKNNIRKLRIDVSVEDNNGVLSNFVDNCCIPDTEFKKHPRTERIFNKYSYSKEFLIDLRKKLDKARFSKVIKERIMKMYHNYNNCIKDPAFVVSFLGFRPFFDSLNRIVDRYITGSSETTSRDMHEWLDSVLRDFEQAYLNRFHQSYLMRTITDFNMEWNGGIQQIISSMDYTYKLLMKCCGIRIPKSFMYISGYERIHVSDHSYRINMQHLTFPELFVTTMWKEMFNFMPPELTKKADEDLLPLKRFTDRDFIDRLKVSVFNHCNFNSANNVHVAFYHNLDQELMTSVLADSMAFYYGYNKDVELYQYWYWRYFMQTPMCYNKDGAIDRTLFFMFLIRMLLVRMIGSENPKEVDSLRFTPFDPALGSEWISLFDDALSLSRILYEQLEKFQFSRLIKNTSIKLLFNTYPELVKKVKVDNMGIVDTMNATTESIVNQRKRVYKDCIEHFNDRIIPTEYFTSESTSDFICGFLPVYLVYIRGLDKSNSDGRKVETCDKKECLLPRNEEGLPHIPRNESHDELCFSNILSDPCGGFFCTDSIIAEQYFAVRSIYYMTIFHLYHCDILGLIDDTLS